MSEPGPFRPMSVENITMQAMLQRTVRTLVRHAHYLQQMLSRYTVNARFLHLRFGWPGGTIVLRIVKECSRPECKE